MKTSMDMGGGPEKFATDETSQEYMALKTSMQVVLALRQYVEEFKDTVVLGFLHEYEMDPDFKKLYKSTKTLDEETQKKIDQFVFQWSEKNRRAFRYLLLKKVHANPHLLSDYQVITVPIIEEFERDLYQNHSSDFDDFADQQNKIAA